MENELAGARDLGVNIRLHVTQGYDLNEEKTEGSEAESIDKPKVTQTVALGKPDIPAIVHQACRSNIGSMAIAGWSYRLGMSF